MNTTSKQYSPYLNPELCGQEWRYSPALARLNGWRKRADEYNEKHPRPNNPRTWRSVRFSKYPGASGGTYSECRTKFYIDSLDHWPGRQEGDAHKITRLEPTGWYADYYQDALLKGAVVSIHTPTGRRYYPASLLKGAVVSIHTPTGRRYYPATYCTGWEGATVYIKEGTDDKEQAARWADQNAQSEAEESREAYAKDAAEQEISEKREEIHAINHEALALIREIKGNQYTPAVCEAIKQTLRHHLKDRRRAFKRIEKLKDDYWLAVPNW